MACSVVEHSLKCRRLFSHPHVLLFVLPTLNEAHGVVMFLLLAASLAHAGDPQPVEIVVQEEGTAVTVSVRVLDASVALPGCRAVGWEGLDDDVGGFAPLPGAACGPMTEAIWLGDGEYTARYAPTVGGFQVVRPVVVYGVGCRRGLPFALAGCDSVEVLRGSNASVRPKQADPK